MNDLKKDAKATVSDETPYQDVPVDEAVKSAKNDPDIRWIGQLGRKTPEWTRTKMNADRFPVDTCGIRIDQVNGHESICSVAIRPELYNTKAQMMGGAIFTLGDFSTAVADIMPGMEDTTVDGHIQYLATTVGTRLYAHVTCLHYGHSIAYYNVRFVTDEGRHVANGTYTYAHLPQKDEPHSQTKF